MTKNFTQNSSDLSAADYVSSRIGEPFDRVERHCWWLVRTVYRDRAGIDLPPILDRLPEGMRGGAVAKELFASHQERARWHAVPEPQELAIVLLRKVFFEHVGVFFQVGAGGVLHSDEPYGVVFDTPLQLRQIRRFEIAGYFVRA
jgi:hypothetical protein